ncbi:heavy-metal-associated domain-containing protein [Clostridiaceae bacterium UIB06]|uniref:Heavy-metal-associated domain-containing protein n=1 Tax=Clostridium thailandense TaxID=2794346 RepID=A0A949TTW8_9CLOT|nr:heavy metal-associated domain-containing protein [Clostridium thailandense]MBV7271816.1 heavy-metal-associated domain-containing protein [Clostridium thailandense]MCH5135612.1 heavy-metal-associated domain-containing protein [Clostridiaceae bacterium UIB06]
MRRILTVEGISCKNCEKHIHNALMELPGVKSVAVDIRTKTAFLESNLNLGNDKIKEAVDGAGYKLIEIEKV